VNVNVNVNDLGQGAGLCLPARSSALILGLKPRLVWGVAPHHCHSSEAAGDLRGERRSFTFTFTFTGRGRKRGRSRPSVATRAPAGFRPRTPKAGTGAAGSMTINPRTAPETTTRSGRGAVPWGRLRLRQAVLTGSKFRLDLIR